MIKVVAKGSTAKTKTVLLTFSPSNNHVKYEEKFGFFLILRAKLSEKKFFLKDTVH